MRNIKNKKEKLLSTEELTNGVTKWKLRRAPKENWSKIAQYDHTEFKLAPLVSSRTGRPSTGLTVETAERLAAALGLEKTELYDRSSYWDDFFVGIGDGITVLDVTDAEEELIFLFLCANKFVAFGHKELKINSKALFVLYNDVDEAKAQVKSRNSKKRAYKHFNDMDNQEMIDTLMVMGEKIVSTDPSIVEAMMGRIVDKRSGEFVEIFGDEDFKMKLFITKCLHYDILKRGQGKTLEDMKMSFGNDVIGIGIDEVTEFLKKKANQDTYLALAKRIEMAQAAGTLAGTPVLSGYEIEEQIKAQPTRKQKTERKVVSVAQTGKIRKDLKGKGHENVVQKGGVSEVVGSGLDSAEYEESEM
jgi:hypothetical protein